MPMYSYRCTKCPAKLEIIRPIKESDSPPSEQEVAGLPVCTEDSVHNLERYIASAPNVLKGSSWGPGKGYW